MAIQYRWAEDHRERLAALAEDLAQRNVVAIVASGASVGVAKSATPTIPIVFVVGTDPVASGLVGSFNRPGGNVTGGCAMFARRAERPLSSVAGHCQSRSLKSLQRSGRPSLRLGARLPPAVGTTCRFDTPVSAFAARTCEGTTPSDYNKQIRRDSI